MRAQQNAVHRRDASLGTWITEPTAIPAVKAAERTMMTLMEVFAVQKVCPTLGSPPVGSVMLARAAGHEGQAIAHESYIGTRDGDERGGSGADMVTTPMGAG